MENERRQIEGAGEDVSGREPSAIVRMSHDQSGRTDIVGLAILVDVPAAPQKEAFDQERKIFHRIARRRLDNAGGNSGEFQTINLATFKHLSSLKVLSHALSTTTTPKRAREMTRPRGPYERPSFWSCDQSGTTWPAACFWLAPPDTLGNPARK